MMKTTQPFFIIGLSAVGLVALFLVFENKNHDVRPAHAPGAIQGDSSGTEQTAPAAARLAAENPHSRDEWTRQREDFARRHEENRQKRKETMEKAAQATAKITPELQKQLLGITMRHWEPRYRELFDSWNLDPKTLKRVLDVIQERERYFIERPGRLAQEMNTDEYLSNIAHARKVRSDYHADRLIAQTLTETQLIDLLGVNRFKELAQLEAKMKSELRRSAAD